jgi:hypothetical protein
MIFFLISTKLIKKKRVVALDNRTHIYKHFSSEHKLTIDKKNSTYTFELITET